MPGRSSQAEARVRRLRVSLFLRARSAPGSIKRRVLIFLMATIVIGALAAVATARSGQRTRFVIGVQATVTGSTVTGTFSVAGAFSDSGSDTATFSVLPTSEGTLLIRARADLIGADGTLSLEFRIVSGPSGAVRQFGAGQATVTAASGAYAGLVGKKLSLEEESDLGTGTLTQLLLGTAG